VWVRAVIEITTGRADYYAARLHEEASNLFGQGVSLA